MKLTVHRDLTNSIEDFRLIDVYEAALRDLLAFYDRVTGVSPGGNGWTATDVLRLEEIRMVGVGTVPNSQSRPLQPAGKANGSGTPCKTRKAGKRGVMPRNAMKNHKNDPKYPFVRCDAHPGEDEPGYAVCQHVLDGAPVAHYKLANPDRLGEVLCAPCGAKWNRPRRVFDVKLLVLCCAYSVRDRGLDHVAVQ